MTILRCSPGKRLAKRWRINAPEPDDYDGGALFQATTVPVASVADLAALLEEMSAEPSYCVVRGRPKDDVGDAWVQRLSVARADVEAAFKSASHRWIALDVDHTHVRTSDGVSAWAASLPDEFRGAAFVWQHSANAHISATLRGRAWFWLDEAVDDTCARAWAIAHGFDPSLYTPVAIHYTAAPIFDGGTDPINVRVVRVDGAPTARLVVPPSTRTAATRVSARAEVGTPNPRYDGARAAVIEALGPAAEHEGHRWHLCGPLGGMARKAAWPAADCAALIRAWLAPIAGADCDVEHGVRRALGAYTLDDANAAAGYRDIAALIGDASAEACGAALASTAYRGRFATVVDHDDPLAAIAAVDDHYAAPPSYICKGLQIATGKASGIDGGSHAGKTPFALALAVHAALGREFCGHAIDAPTPVLYLAFEGGIAASRTRVRICRGIGVDSRDVPLVVRRARRGLDSEDALASLGEYIARTKTRLVIVDTLTSAQRSGARQNEAEYARLVFDLGDLSEELDCAVVVLTHKAKAGGRDLAAIAGTQAIGAALQSVIDVHGTKPRHADVHCARELEDPFDDFAVVYEDVVGEDGDPKWGFRVSRTEREAKATGGIRATQARIEAATTRRAAAQSLWSVVAASPVAVERRELVAVSGLSHAKASALIADLTRAGVLEYVPPGAYRAAANMNAAAKAFAGL